eukprot:14526446-Ditylum_brightwellii.AAC.1
MVKTEENKIKVEVTNQDKKRNIAATSYNKFDGRSEELKGYMFDKDPRNINNYFICKEEIAWHVGA